MKKQIKLKLQVQTLRPLQPVQLSGVAGGGLSNWDRCSGSCTCTSPLTPSCSIP